MKGSLSRVAPKEPFWLLFPKNSQIEMAQNSIPASMVPSLCRRFNISWWSHREGVGVGRLVRHRNLCLLSL